MAASKSFSTQKKKMVAEALKFMKHALDLHKKEADLRGISQASSLSYSLFFLSLFWCFSWVLFFLFVCMSAGTGLQAPWFFFNYHVNTSNNLDLFGS